jgi:hypothetical protein
MKIKKDFTIQAVGASYIAVAVGETSRTFHSMITLNESGAFLWKLMAERDCSEADLVAAILDRYDIDQATAEADVKRLIESLAGRGIFENA